MPKDQMFYIGQKAFIDKKGKLLVLNDPLLGMDLPGGKIQVGEFDFAEALKREVKEETQLDIEIAAPFATWYFKVPEGNHRSAGKLIFMIGFRCRYLSGEIKLSDEHNGFTWINKNDLPKLKSDWSAYPAIKEYFRYSP